MFRACMTALRCARIRPRASAIRPGTTARSLWSFRPFRIRSEQNPTRRRFRRRVDGPGVFVGVAATAPGVGAGVGCGGGQAHSINQERLPGTPLRVSGQRGSEGAHEGEQHRGGRVECVPSIWPVPGRHDMVQHLDRPVEDGPRVAYSRKQTADDGQQHTRGRRV